MNKENIRKELKRLDSLIFETRMCLSCIEKEFYHGMTITNESEVPAERKYNSVGLEYITGRDPGDENGSE
jgi:hypothetical protein